MLCLYVHACVCARVCVCVHVCACVPMSQADTPSNTHTKHLGRVYGDPMLSVAAVRGLVWVTCCAGGAVRRRLCMVAPPPIS